MLCFCHTQCSQTLLPSCIKQGAIQLPSSALATICCMDRPGSSAAQMPQASCCYVPPFPAVQVHVGSLSDPDDLPGLAHFLEHMLFYSSEKYPQEDAYSKFVSEHGGSTNAFTSGEQ